MCSRQENIRIDCDYLFQSEFWKLTCNYSKYIWYNNLVCYRELIVVAS